MAYKILFTEDALVDLEIILDYVRDDNPSAAERFGSSLLNYSNCSRAFPESASRSRDDLASVRFFTLPCGSITGCMKTELNRNSVLVARGQERPTVYLTVKSGNWSQTAS